MIKPFQFNTKRKRRAVKSMLKDGKFVAVESVVETEAIMQPIQGQMPDSIEEYRFAIALERLGYEYSFQFPLEAGRL